MCQVLAIARALRLEFNEMKHVFLAQNALNTSTHSQIWRFGGS
jgi:hypothetical protein